ncbi:MAG: TonB-dependent receptor plug domain-containing protein, partial [Desulfurellaceae bacterium]|nr:TonB-dependent receptor plug domain-containing protein [Desulfurellaceae bacterium]
MRTSCVWSLAAVLVVCLGTTSPAQDSPQQTPASGEQPVSQPVPPSSAPAVMLDKISVTATKSEERSVSNIPGHVSVIDRQDIERYQAQDLADLLRYEPGIDIVSGPRRITERPSIRGLSGTRVLLTVDGARLNYNTAHGGNLNFVDIESLERLEIIRGPASALYGSSALGGTINMLTKSGSEMLRPGQTVGARARWTFNSNNQELSEHVSLYGIIGKRFDYIVSYTRHDASDVETARDTIDNSGFRTNDVFLKSRYFVTERDTLSFTTQLFRDTSDIPFASSDQYASRTQDDDTDRNLFNLRYEHHSPGSWLSRITWLGYLHQTDIQEDEKRRAPDHSRTRIKDDLDWDTWGS